jgi:accessory colonization factor AcfC
MKTKRQKIDETFQLLESARKQVLTTVEREFIKTNTTKRGSLVIKNPDPVELRTVESLEKKGIKIIVIHRKIIDK